MKKEYILIIDTGCSIVKAVIFDLEGNTIIEEKTRVPFIFKPPHTYYKYLGIVWNKAKELIRSAISKSGLSASDIKAVSSVSYANGLILLDNDGIPMCEAISSTDGRANDIVRTYYKDGISDKLREYTLQNIWAGQTAPIVRWMHENNKELLEKSSSIVLSKDYTNFKLTGNILTDKTSISSSNLFSLKDSCYDDEILTLLGISEYKGLLPEVRDCTDLCGCITRKAADETGLIEGTPVTTGLYDLAGSALSSGMVTTKNKENLLINIIAGTWTIDQYLTSTPQNDPNVFATRIHPKAGHWTISRNSITSTSNLDWFISNFMRTERAKADKTGGSVFDYCNKALSSTRPEESDIIFLPFIYGSNIGSKITQENELKAAFWGVKSSDRQEHIIRAIYEGITYSHLFQIKQLFSSFPQTALIRLAGGGSASNEWATLFADSIQAPVETTCCCNTHALGSAICAAVGTGHYSSLEEATDNMVHIKNRISPNFYKKEIYAEKYYKYTALISKLTGMKLDTI